MLISSYGPDVVDEAEEALLEPSLEFTHRCGVHCVVFTSFMQPGFSEVIDTQPIIIPSHLVRSGEAAAHSMCDQHLFHYSKES